MYDSAMKHIKFLISVMCLSGLLGALASCKSTKATAPVEAEEKPAVVVEEPKPAEPAPEPTPVVEPEQEPEPVVVVEAPEEAEPEPAPAVEEDKEYLRSVGDIAIDVDTYTHDKEAIMKIIAELATIMNTMDYKSWLAYVDDDSKAYWSRRPNLQKAEKKLPVKGLKLQTLEDYFKHVFVPARKGRNVTEIRYISDTYVKAVQVEADKDIIFYYFNKIKGEWLLHLSKLED